MHRLTKVISSIMSRFSSKEASVNPGSSHGDVLAQPLMAKPHELNVTDEQRKSLSSLDERELDNWDVLPDMEKFIIAMKLKGYNNPLGAGNFKRKELSTIDDPNIIASFLDKRPMGCICEEDDCHVKWMMLHKGETKRCFCGHWFKLVEAKFPDLTEFGINAEVMEHMIRNT